MESMNVLMVTCFTNCCQELTHDITKDENIGRFLETYRDYCQDVENHPDWDLFFKK